MNDERYDPKRNSADDAPRPESSYIAESFARYSAMPLRGASYRDPCLMLVGLECGHCIPFSELDVVTLRLEIADVRLRCYECYVEGVRRAACLIDGTD